MTRYLPLLLISLVGCTQATPAAPKIAPPVSDAEAVELAKNWVLNNHPGAKILKVGPNLGHAEMAAMKREAVGSDVTSEMFDGAMIRVKFDDKDRVKNNPQMALMENLHPGATKDIPTVMDKIYQVRGKIIALPVIDNSKGDNWVPAFREMMAKKFPGIKVR